jgi:lactoylglutathione lyase
LKQAAITAAAATLSSAAQTEAEGGSVSLENDQALWEFALPGEPGETRLRNKLTGRRYTFRRPSELLLTFSAAKARIEIPAWRCTFGRPGETDPSVSTATSWAWRSAFCNHRRPKAWVEALLWVGGRGCSMLGLYSLGSTWPLTIMQHHVVFEVALDDLFAAPAKLRRVGVTPLGGKREPINEPVVFSWMPAASVFFDDPDGNLLEFIEMLDDEPQPEIGPPVCSWSQWQSRRKKVRLSEIGG